MRGNYLLLGRIAIRFMRIPKNTPKNTHDAGLANPPARTGNLATNYI